MPKGEHRESGESAEHRNRTNHNGEDTKMSRAQGDSYKTRTNHELNAYRARLDAKLHKLIDRKEHWFRVGDGWILTAEQNRMINRNGSWKWNGWEVEAHEYWITVFPAECVEIENGQPHVIGWAQRVMVIDDDKAAANEYFKTVAKPLAENLKTWIPAEDKTGVFIDYAGRKPRAMIIIGWDAARYHFSLVIDGNEVMQSQNQLELREEAARLGAELMETHTP